MGQVFIFVSFIHEP